MKKLCVHGAVSAFLLIGSIAAAGQAAEQKSPPDPARLNVLAHRLLDAAAKSNAMTGESVKPWHMKLEFQLVQGMNYAKPDKGTMEEWYAGSYRWRRTFTSSQNSWSGSEWSVSKFERYARKEKHEEFDDYGMTLRVARPVVDPLYQIANLKPTDQLTVQRVTSEGLAVNCVWFAETAPAAQARRAEWSFPTMCFDADLHLRLVHSEDTTVQFEDIQPFHGRGVARQIKILFQGHLTADLKVTQLEDAESIDPASLAPPSDAVAMPYVIEPGSPRPVSEFETGAVIPLMPNGQPFRGRLLIQAIIRKDGTVKVVHGASNSFLQAIFDAANSAVAKWKFKPYVVDGQAVEARYDVPYTIDGKPFVPSYERAASGDERIAEPAAVTNLPTAGDATGAPRRGRR
jgi:hypothetical protein